MMTKQKNLQITEIDTARIRPNPFNPNRMSKKQMDELRAEIKHLGTLPQPLRVRPSGEEYEVVDGEHRLKIAQEREWATVPCIIVPIDDFEARRQCFKFNRHGRDNPVLLGRMFGDMIAQMGNGGSPRKLSAKISVPATTIDLYVRYAKAAELRSACASETADADIAKLKQDQVRYYLGLPDDIRDLWLDSGADLDAFVGCGDWPADRVAHEILQRKLAPYLASKSTTAFVDAVWRLWTLCLWCERHQIQEIAGYLSPVAEFGLSANALDLLPLKATGKSCHVLISPDAWRRALASANEHGGNGKGVIDLIQSAVHVALRQAGHDPADVCGPETAEALQVIAEGPEFIRQADFLTLKERHYLSTVTIDADAETIVELQRRVVDRLRAERSQPVKKRNRARTTIQQALEECLAERKGIPCEWRFAHDDVETLLSDVCERLAKTAAIQESTIDDVPAAEVLNKRLRLLEWPELQLIAIGVLCNDDAENTAGIWLDAIQGVPSAGGSSE